MTNYNEESLARYKRKIAQLLAMANDAAATEHERDSFMTKAQEMMSKYQLELKDIKNAEDIMAASEGTQKIYVANMWGKMLIHHLARMYGCRALFHAKQGSVIPYSFYGRESARITTDLMVPVIIRQIRTEARKLATRGIGTQSINEREVAQAVTTRIWEIMQKMELEPGNEIVAAEAEAKAHMNSVTVVKSDNRKKKFGYGEDAKNAAGNVSLHRQATGGTGNKPLLIGRG